VRSHAQCNLKFEYKIEKSNSGNGFDILIKAIEAKGNLQLLLVDRINPEKGILKKVSYSSSDLQKDFVTVFRDEKPSTYIIQVIDKDKCQISIGGLEGITLSN
jgi:hypothetical protein